MFQDNKKIWKKKISKTRQAYFPTAEFQCYCPCIFSALHTSVGWRTALQAGSIPDGVIGIFQWYNISGRTIGPGVDSASNRNEYQVYFLGVKATGA